VPRGGCGCAVDTARGPQIEFFCPNALYFPIRTLAYCDARLIADARMTNPGKVKAAPILQSDSDAVGEARLFDKTAGDVPALSHLVQHLLEQELYVADRIGRMLHDHLGPALAAVRMHIDLLKPVAGVPANTDRSVEIDAIDALLDEAISDVRRMLDELHLPSLAGRGLATALEHEMLRLKKADQVVDVLLEAEESLRLMRWPTAVEVGAFMIAREAMDNALHHEGVSLIRVVLTGSVGCISLQVIDDGRGSPAVPAGPSRLLLTLTTMRERARAMGAQLAVSVVAGGNTCVRLDWEAQAA
jgi:signal transduction histidine kinase